MIGNPLAAKCIMFLAMTFTVISIPAAASAQERPALGEAHQQLTSTRIDWTGIYIGGSAGYGWGSGRVVDLSLDDPTSCINLLLPSSIPGTRGVIDLVCSPALGIPASDHAFQSVNYRGPTGGGRIGFDWQTGDFVFGAIGDFQAGSIGGTSVGSTPAAIPTRSFVNFPPLDPGFSAAEQRLSAEVNGLATLRARAGVAVQNLLFFGTGGIAVGTVKTTISMTKLGSSTPAEIRGSSELLKAGWVAGGGVEFALNDAWSVGVEHLYFNLGDQTATGVSDASWGVSGLMISATQRLSGNLLRGHINYRF